METWNRRDVVRGLGVVGLGVLGTREAALASEPSHSPRAVLEQIRLAGAQEQVFLERLGRSATRPSELPPGATTRRSRLVEPEVFVKRSPDGLPFAYGLRYLCDPRTLNRLAVDGVPLAVRRFCFSADDISWSPGPGAPVYGVYAPRFEPSLAAYYPTARWHQIVPVSGDRWYFAGCQGDDVCESESVQPIAFDVNDSHHEDNLGYYRVTLWSWS